MTGIRPPVAHGPRQGSASSPECARGLELSAKELTWCLIVVSELGVLGLLLAVVVGTLPIGGFTPESSNVFYRLYGLHEPALFALLALFALVALWLIGKPALQHGLLDSSRVVKKGWLIAAVILCSAWSGNRLVMRSFPLAMDEYNAVFQSQIFAAGKTMAPIPAEWLAMAPAITPYFVTYRDDSRAWMSAYLPWRA